VHRFSSVVLVDERGWLLLQERDEHPVIDPERWGFPGGGVEPGESYEQAAYRELAEETGIEMRSGLELFGTFDVHHEHSGSDDEFTLWAGTTDATDADIRCGEGRQIVFVDPERARGLDLTAAAAIVMPLFLASDLYRRLSNGAHR
jgi:8-oxo-dGTP diphosphatase